jgi:hypothetical protein
LNFDNFVNSVKKSAIKRDGPVFFSSASVKVACDERTLIAIVAPHRGETSHPADLPSRWTDESLYASPLKKQITNLVFQPVGGPRRPTKRLIDLLK